MPDTFVMRTSANRDGTVLRSPDVFSPGTDLHGTMSKADASKVISYGVAVRNNIRSVSRINTQAVNSQSLARRLGTQIKPEGSITIRQSPKVEPVATPTIRNASKVTPVEEGVRNV